MGFVAAREGSEAKNKAGDGKNHDYENKDIGCFPHVTHLFSFNFVAHKRFLCY